MAAGPFFIFSDNKFPVRDLFAHYEPWREVNPMLVTEDDYRGCCCVYCRVRWRFTCETHLSEHEVDADAHCEGNGSDEYLKVGPLPEGTYRVRYEDKAWSTDTSHTNCDGGPSYNTEILVGTADDPDGDVEFVSSALTLPVYPCPGLGFPSAAAAISASRSYGAYWTFALGPGGGYLCFYTRSQNCGNNWGTIEFNLSKYEVWTWTGWFRKTDPFPTETQNRCDRVHYSTGPESIPGVVSCTSGLDVSKTIVETTETPGPIIGQPGNWSGPGI